MSKWFSLGAAVAVVLVAAPARASNGFVFGLEIGAGNLASPTGITTASPTVNGEYNPGLSQYVQSNWWPVLGLHLGWNILGYAAIEAAVSGFGWDLLAANRGGGGLVGARATFYPFQIFFPRRIWDVGLEFGGGWTILGGEASTDASAPSYGLAGGYFSFAVTGEVYVAPFVSLELFYRLYAIAWDRFYTNYNQGVYSNISQFSSTWNVLGFGVSFHAG